VCEYLAAVTLQLSKHKQGRVVVVHLLLNAIDEKIVLVHINLHTRCATIEVEQCLGTVLKKGVGVQLFDHEKVTYMHHFRIALTIASVEKV
jgi:hypothetical protein